MLALRLQEQELRIALWQDGLLAAPWVGLAGHEVEEAASRLRAEQERMVAWPVVDRPVAFGERVVTEAEVERFRSRLSSLDELRRVRQRLAGAPW